MKLIDNMTILATEPLLHENKQFQQKMLPLVRIEPGTSDLKSDTLFSELTHTA